MHNYITIFRQILQLLPDSIFKKAVRKYATDRYIKHFTTFRLLITLLYAQITGKDSLRDIVSGLDAQKSKKYHIGLSSVTRSNLSYACNSRDFRVFEEVFNTLLAHCRANSRSKKFRFNAPVYALDSTRIEMCLSLFPWAEYRQKKGAMKIHQLLDLQKGLPVFLVMTEGKIHDVKVARDLDLPISSDSILVMDRGYIDFEWFKKLDNDGVYFVTRARKNMDYRVIGQHSVNDMKKITSDEIIELNGIETKKSYPGQLRLVTACDIKNGKTISILTNHFRLAASTIAKIYKERWEIEKFFRWIKQNLKIKTFIGTSKNAVMLQVWAAMIYYLLLFHMKEQTKWDCNLLELSRRIKAVLFENKPLLDILSLNSKSTQKLDGYAVQLTLF